MKKRRIVSDDKEEEDMCRRNSLCKRETISCVPSISQHETNEQLGPSTQLQHYNQRAHRKKLRVTCGVKKGKLDVEKLAIGVDSILCERRWFSPSGFGSYAGKQRKQWKTSIFYHGEPLKMLLDKGILKAKRHKGRRTGTEIYSGQETEGNDWLPVKEEKERQEAESGGDVNTTEGKETEELEIKVESMPAVSDEGNNNNVCEEMQTVTCGKRAARVVLKRLEEERTERQSNCPEPEQPKEDNYEEHLETSVQPSENIKNSKPGKECPEPMSHSPKPLRKQADKSTHTDATTNDHEAAQIQKINQETSDPQASHSLDIEEVSSSRCSAGIDLETMDLDQLKKEKTKMQIKVLKLQEEYYTMKIQGFRK